MVILRNLLDLGEKEENKIEKKQYFKILDEVYTFDKLLTNQRWGSISVGQVRSKSYK